MIAVVLNVGGGAAFSYQTDKTVHVHAKTLQTQRGWTHGAQCSRPCFHTAEPLGEHRYENYITTNNSEVFKTRFIGIHTNVMV